MTVSAHQSNEKKEGEIRILLVEDHTLVADIIEKYIIDNSDYSVLTVNSYKRAMEVLEDKGQFNLILLDYCLPDMFGLEYVSELMEKAPQARVAIISGAVFGTLGSKSFIQQALRLGVIGLIPKTIKIDDLMRAIEAMSSGLQYVPVDLMIGGLHAQTDQKSERKQISDREYEILCLVALGLQNKNISERLSLKEPTVKMHIQSLFRKLDASNRTELVRIAKNAGMI